MKLINILKTINLTINEAVDSNSFPKFESFLEKIIPSNKGIQFFVEEHRLLIGYFPKHASMAELSKQLPETIVDKIEDKFAGSQFTVMNMQKPDPMSGKPMKFTAISAKNQPALKQIEKLF